tara:strand:+ start:101 stop:1063 length:963 start_codon:yes stop_codon:yes gene_type:complete
MEDDVNRGDLKTPKTTSGDRVQSGVSVPGDVVGAGLIQPLGLTLMDGIFYATEKNVGFVTAVDPADGDVSIVAEGFETANLLTNDGTHLYVTDTTAGAVVQVSLAGTKTEVATGLSNPTYVVADANHVYFSDDTTVYRASTSDLEPEVWAGDLDGVAALTLNSGNLYFVEAGTSSATNARVVKMNTTSAIENVLVANSPSIGTAFLPKALSITADGSQLYFPLQYRNWPWYAFPCSVSTSGGTVSCQTYSPPQPVGMEHMNGTIYWGTRFTMTQYTPGNDAAFSHVGAWTRPGAMLQDDGSLYWVDQIDGRIYRHTPEND